MFCDHHHIHKKKNQSQNNAPLSGYSPRIWLNYQSQNLPYLIVFFCKNSLQLLRKSVNFCDLKVSQYSHLRGVIVAFSELHTFILTDGGAATPGEEAPIHRRGGPPADAVRPNERPPKLERHSRAARPHIKAVPRALHGAPRAAHQQQAIYSRGRQNHRREARNSGK